MPDDTELVPTPMSNRNHSEKGRRGERSSAASQTGQSPEAVIENADAAFSKMLKYPDFQWPKNRLPLTDEDHAKRKAAIEKMLGRKIEPKNPA